MELRTGAPVEAIDAGGVTAAGERIHAATVIWCAGVAATPVARWLGVPSARNGAVPAAPDMSLPGRPEVSVIGDAAQVAGPAPVAKQQGAHMAKAIAARAEGRPAPGPFRYRDWSLMATIGRSAAVELFGRAQVTKFAAWLLRGAVHIIPTPSDQNSWSQARRPMEVILAGWARSLFQASQQWATMSS